MECGTKTSGVSLHPQLPLIAPNRNFPGLRHLYTHLYSHRRFIPWSFKRAVQHFPPFSLPLRKSASGDGAKVRSSTSVSSTVFPLCRDSLTGLTSSFRSGESRYSGYWTVLYRGLLFSRALALVSATSFACGSLCPCSATGLRSYRHPA